MSQPDQGYWRWNVNFPWECFSSGWEFLQKAKSSRKEHQLFTNVRASIMFLMTYMDASFNERMRDKFKNDNKSEDKLFELLRYTKIMEKLKQWPAILSGSNIRLDDKLVEQFESLKNFRDGIVHWKDKDHSRYRITNSDIAQETCDCVTRITLALCQAMHEDVPYWLLGINFVNPVSSYELHLMRNHEFWWHIQVARVQQGDFEPLYSAENFFRLRDVVSTLGSEPKSERFPHAPRLTPRWWLDESEEMDRKERKAGRSFLASLVGRVFNLKAGRQRASFNRKRPK